MSSSISKLFKRNDEIVKIHRVLSETREELREAYNTIHKHKIDYKVLLKASEELQLQLDEKVT